MYLCAWLIVARSKDVRPQAVDTLAIYFELLRWEETRAYPRRLLAGEAAHSGGLYMAFLRKDDRKCGGPATRLDETNVPVPRPTPTETKCDLPCGPSRWQRLPKLEFPTRTSFPRPS